MGHLEIRDHVVWIKHIHQNEGLQKALIGLAAGQLVELKVDGIRGMWKKMDDGKDGRQTPGIKPIGKARVRWHALQDRRGDLVPIKFLMSVSA